MNPAGDKNARRVCKNRTRAVSATRNSQSHIIYSKKNKNIYNVITY